MWPNFELVDYIQFVVSCLHAVSSFGRLVFDTFTVSLGACRLRFLFWVFVIHASLYSLVCMSLYQYVFAFTSFVCESSVPCQCRQLHSVFILGISSYLKLLTLEAGGQSRELRPCGCRQLHSVFLLGIFYTVNLGSRWTKP